MKLNPETTRILFAGCAPEPFTAGQTLFLQDDPAERLYALHRGQVEISIYSRSGRKLVANIVNEGLIGEIGTLDGGTRTATATCFTECEILSISRAQFFDRMRRHPELAMEMIGLLCDHIRRISGELGDQALLNISARLAKKLISLGLQIGGDGGWIEISQAELAENLGATRESVNKTLKDWQRRGAIDLRRGAVRVINSRQLSALAADRE